ncbi:MAG: patatin family protein [Methanocorpusculum sp.]|nr:patatin family protein [Methanocorpusculum sp.]
MADKTGLVVEGGGMKCAYSAGILDRFLDDAIFFDECIGVSAGAGNVASYLAGQRGRNLRFYSDHIGDPEYAGVRNYIRHGSYFNLPYVYGTLSNSTGVDPFDYAAALANPAEFLLTTTDAETGEPRYFRKEEMHPDDYRVIMASCAIPGFCKPIEIDGRLYYDGGASDSIPLARAFADGCDKAVVILENPRSFVRPPQKYKAGYHFLLRKYPKIVERIDERHVAYAKVQKFVYEMERAGRAFVFAPSDMAGVTTSSSDAGLMRRLYDVGVADYEKDREALLAFLGR